MKAIPFFSDEIVINVTASNSDLFTGRPVVLKDFYAASGSMFFGLYEFDNGELLYKAKENGDFIQGFEVV